MFNKSIPGRVYYRHSTANSEHVIRVDGLVLIKPPYTLYTRSYSNTVDIKF